MASDSSKKNAYYWKDIKAPFKVPPSAFRGGTDADGSPIYVGRAKHGGDLLPGSLVPSKGTTRVAFAGREHNISKAQVLCCNRPCLEWVPSYAGNDVPLAIQAGKTNIGEVLYVGRVHHMASQTVGKIHRSHNVCYIPFDGKELMYQHYEVLVFNS